MSGKKRILVDESEWYRLQREGKRMREVKRELPGLIAGVRRQTEADLERVLGEVEERQRKVDEVVAGLSDRTRGFESEMSRRIGEQSDRLEESLRSAVGEVRQETRELVAEQRNELAEERRQRRDEMRRLARRVDDVVEQGERAAKAASDSLRDGRAMHNLIRDTLPHERLAPGELARHERRLATARDNLNEGNPDAALAVAQEAYFGLSDLRIELELRDREWRVARTAAGESLIRLDALIDQEAVRDARDEAGRALEDVKLDVDYWARGELSRLRDEVAELLGVVRDDEKPMSAEELRDVVEDRAPKLEERLEEIVERAGMQQLASQLRVNLADAVVRTLDDTAGYEFEDGTYVGEDQREAFYAKLVHENGNEIVVDVSPVSPDSGRCVLRVLSYDRDTASEEDRLDRARAVASGLRDRGLDVDEPVAEAGEPDPAMRDLEAVKREVPQTLEGR
jgi:hypothetical protein